jgi:pyruvate,water dikinase
MALVRYLLLELGERLARRQLLAQPSDIFFLLIQEVDPVRLAQANFDVRQRVRARRAEYETNLLLRPPPLVIGRFDPQASAIEPPPGGIRLLKGLAISPGVVTGPARVIIRSDTREEVHPGEILVAPFTDPGWTPYFLRAAGIVMDQGGLLSHGSIVAREYGIPAVVNVGPATEIIRTGQRIEVDGNRGQVRILDEVTP